MAYDAYQSAALILRYGVSALGVFIAGRAMYMTLYDAGRAARLRAEAKETGKIAELRASLDGKSRVCCLQREGMAGSSIRADVRLTGMRLHRREFYYEIVGGNLVVTPLAHATLTYKRGGDPAVRLIVPPGAHFFAEDAEFKFIMYTQKAVPLSPMALRAYGDKLDAVMGRREKAKRDDERPKAPGGAEKPVNPRK